MANLALVFDILAKDGASGPFRNVGNAAERAGQQTSRFGTAMSGALKLASGALLGAGIVQGFKALYEAADESRKITALTGAVIKSTGGEANVSAKQVGDLAASIAKKTGVDDEAIQSGENLLLTFTNVRNEVGAGNDIFNQATQTITDMSVALGQDTSASAIQLGKALNDPIKGVTALQKVGVSFTQSQKDQIRTLVETGDVMGAQKIILAELGKEFGGAAEAAATPLGKLQQRVGDLAEQIGGYLLPVVDSAATFFTDKLLPGLSSVGATLGSTVGPAFTAITSVVGAVAEAFGALPGPVQAAVVAITAVRLLQGPVVAAFETIALKALYMKDAMLAAGTGMGAVKAAGAGLISLLGGPWGIALLAVAGSFALLSSATDENKKVTRDTTAAQQDFASALRASNGVINESVRAAAAKAAQDAGLLDAAENAGVATNLVTDALLGNKGAYDQVSAALGVYANGRLIASGYEEHGSTTLHDQADAALAAKDSFAEMAGVLPQTVVGQQQLAAATATGSTTMQTFAQQIDAARGEMDEAKQAVDNFKLALDILTGANVSMIQVESAFQAAVAAGTEAVKGMSGNLLNQAGNFDLSSEAGRKAADVLLDVRNSGNNLIATMLQQGATSDQVAAKEAQLRASFIATSGQMGITAGDANRLADQILGIPAARNTAITAPTGGAISEVQALRNTIAGLQDRTVYVKAVVSGAQAVSNLLNGTGMFPARAAGGPVWPGQTFLVGERGPELVQFGSSGFVTPADKTRAALSGDQSSAQGQAAGGRPIVIQTSDNPRAIVRALRAQEQLQAALAPAW